MKRICPNKFGYDNKSREIMMINGTIGNRWKYGSTIFAHKVQLKHNRKILRRSHRNALLLLTRGYRTTSYLPLTVISNTVPLDYQILNRTITYNKTRNITPTFPLPKTIPEGMHKKSEITIPAERNHQRMAE